ncbi:MAG: hypothetical protein JKY65_12435 [Planctomycetes bacterium]|nr:hypothetical protein [Planctomycetota bacterium]
MVANLFLGIGALVLGLTYYAWGEPPEMGLAAGLYVLRHAFLLFGVLFTACALWYRFTRSPAAIYLGVGAWALFALLPAAVFVLGSFFHLESAFDMVLAVGFFPILMGPICAALPLQAAYVIVRQRKRVDERAHRDFEG